MADYGDDDKNQFVVAFGESDGGHAFVTLSDAIDAQYIKSVQPQEDVWGAVDALRTGTAQIAVLPFSNKITSAEAGTVAGLASGELKIIGQITRKTNHVLVGLKDYINQVDQNFKGSYGREGAHPTQVEGSFTAFGPNRAHVSDEPSTGAISRFILLLRQVYSSKTVFDQTRGKLTGSDFRHDIKVQHTSNPMRVLLRYYRDRETDTVRGGLERKTPASGQGQSGQFVLGQDAEKGGYRPIILGQSGNEPNYEKPIEENFFSAALVAEGLLDSARRVCGDGPGLKPNKLCSQRLFEITATLRELQTDAEAPLDLPNNVTTFLVVQSAYAKMGDGVKKAFPWEDGKSRTRAERENLKDEIARTSALISRFQAEIDSLKKQRDDAEDPLKKHDLDQQVQRLDARIVSEKDEIKSFEKAIDKLDGPHLGPKTATPTLRAAFLLSVDGADPDWSRAFKVFEDRMKARFSGWNFKFDQSPELANHLGKPVLLVSARLGGMGAMQPPAIEAEINKFFKKQKEKDAKLGAGSAWLSDMRMGPEKKFEPKLLGVYPSWSVSGANRSTWTGEGVEPKGGRTKRPALTTNWLGIAMFVLFWVSVIFIITITSTPYGRTWLFGLGEGLVNWFFSLFLGPNR